MELGHVHQLLPKTAKIGNDKDGQSVTDLDTSADAYLIPSNDHAMATRGTHTRLYVREESGPTLKKLCENTGLTQTDALTFIVHAGLEAIKASGYRFELPLKFKVQESRRRK